MHKRCLKCDRCHKMLTPANLNTMVEEAKIFCQNCYNDAVMASLVELLFNKGCNINSTHLKGGARNPVPEKVKMQVLPIEGMFKVVSFQKDHFAKTNFLQTAFLIQEKKPIPKEGPTQERLKHDALADARLKAWDDMQKILNKEDEKPVRINDALSW